MKGELLTPYAFKGGNLFCNLVHISDAVSGEQYTCAGCGEDLIIRQGTYVRKHFAHKADSDCSGGGESLVHILAKEAMERMGYITLPNPIPFNSPLEFKINEVKKEVPIFVNDTKYVIDIVLLCDGFELYVEIFYKHKTGKEKILGLQRNGVMAVEIKIIDSASGKVLDFEDLTEQLYNPKHNAKWLVSPVSEDIELRIDQARLHLESKYLKRIADLEQYLLNHQQIIAEYKRQNIELAQKSIISEGKATNHYIGYAQIDDQAKKRGINQYSIFLSWDDIIRSKVTESGHICCKMWKQKNNPHRYPIKTVP
jgi:hypothetical protein